MMKTAREINKADILALGFDLEVGVIGKRWALLEIPAWLDKENKILHREKYLIVRLQDFRYIPLSWSFGDKMIYKLVDVEGRYSLLREDAVDHLGAQIHLAWLREGDWEDKVSFYWEAYKNALAWERGLK